MSSFRLLFGFGDGRGGAWAFSFLANAPSAPRVGDKIRVADEQHEDGAVEVAEVAPCDCGGACGTLVVLRPALYHDECAATMAAALERAGWTEHGRDPAVAQ